MGGMKRAAPSAYHVIIAFAHNNKADRDRLSGVLRYAARAPALNLHIIDNTGDTLMTCRQSSLRKTPLDGAICSDPKAIDILRRNFVLSPRFQSAVIDGLDGNANRGISIEMDIASIYRQAIDIFIHRGYRKVAFLGTTVKCELKWSAAAEAAFVQEANRRGCFTGSFACSPISSLTGGLGDIGKWLSSLPKPCGIMAYSDEIARIALDACHLAHFDVPGSVAIIGLDDDIGFCESCRPALSSFLPDFELSGFMAAKLLNDVLTGKRTPPLRKPYGLKHFSERASTIDPRGGCRLVSLALEIIGKAALKPELSVRDIAAKLHVSARILELSFKRILGHSPKQEITNRRLAALQQQLRYPSVPISTAISKCGFKTLNAAHVAFQRRFGMGMRAWRSENT